MVDDGRTTEHGYTISSPCEPDGSGELTISLFKFHTKIKTSNPYELRHTVLFKMLPKFQLKQIMRMKNIHQVQHDLWKITSQAIVVSQLSFHQKML